MVAGKKRTRAGPGPIIANDRLPRFKHARKSGVPPMCKPLTDEKGSRILGTNFFSALSSSTASTSSEQKSRRGPRANPGHAIEVEGLNVSSQYPTSTQFNYSNGTPLSEVAEMTNILQDAFPDSGDHLNLFKTVEPDFHVNGSLMTSNGFPHRPHKTRGNNRDLGDPYRFTLYSQQNAEQYGVSASFDASSNPAVQRAAQRAVAASAASAAASTRTRRRSLRPRRADPEAVIPPPAWRDDPMALRLPSTCETYQADEKRPLWMSKANKLPGFSAALLEDLREQYEDFHEHRLFLRQHGLVASGGKIGNGDWESAGGASKLFVDEIKLIKRIHHSEPCSQSLIRALADVLGRPAAVVAEVWLRCEEEAPRSLCASRLGRSFFRPGEVSQVQERQALREAYEASLALEISRYGESHPSVLRSRIRLACLLQGFGNLSLAKTHLEKIIANFPDAKNTQRECSRSTGGGMTSTRKKPRRKKKLSKGEGDSGGGDRGGKARCDDGTLGRVLMMLGQLLEDMGNFKEAKESFLKAVRCQEKAFGPGHPLVGIAHANLGGCCVRLHQSKEGRDHLQMGLKVFRKALGYNHLYAKITSQFLISLQTDLDKPPLPPPPPTPTLDPQAPSQPFPHPPSSSNPTPCPSPKPNPSPSSTATALASESASDDSLKKKPSALNSPKTKLGSISREKGNERKAKKGGKQTSRKNSEEMNVESPVVGFRASGNREEKGRKEGGTGEGKVEVDGEGGFEELERRIRSKVERVLSMCRLVSDNLGWDPRERLPECSTHEWCDHLSKIIESERSARIAEMGNLFNNSQDPKSQNSGAVGIPPPPISHTLGITTSYGNSESDDLSFGKLPLTSDEDGKTRPFTNGHGSLPTVVPKRGRVVDGPGYRFHWINQVSEEKVPKNYLHQTKSILHPSVRLDQNFLYGCQCVGECKTEGPDICPCRLDSRNAYGPNGRLHSNATGQVISECNETCACAKKCGPSCTNRVLQLADVSPAVSLQVFRTEEKGWGLRTLTDIPRCSYVCEYVGEIVTEEVAQRRGEKYDVRGCSYLWTQGEFCPSQPEMQPYTIDATDFGNVGRFINHSCASNLLAVSVRVEMRDSRVPRIGIFTSRDVKAGEELTIDYNYEIDDSLPNHLRIPCKCRQPNCRGRLR